MTPSPHTTIADFEWVRSPCHRAILDVVAHEGGEARFVGGCVRNTFLGKAPDDFDVAITLPPEEGMRAFRSAGYTAIPTGIAQGTFTVVTDPWIYEITTLRRDVQTDGRSAVVAFGVSWHDDAARRDFTMNAMYVDADGTVYDYFDGVSDAIKRCVRFIGEPHERIHEDYLRILRFFRMLAWYGKLPADSASLNACRELCGELSRISSERITKEIIKMLAAPDPWDAVCLMTESHVIPHVLGSAYVRSPLIDERITCWRFLEEQANMREHVSPWIRLGLWSESVAECTFSRLRFSRAQRRLVNQICTGISSDLLHSQRCLRKSLYDVGPVATKGRLWQAAVRSSEPLSTRAEQLRTGLEYVDSTALEPLTPFPLRGTDLMALFPELHGERVGYWLEQVRAWWLNTDPLAKKEACLAYFREAYTRSLVK